MSFFQRIGLNPSGKSKKEIDQTKENMEQNREALNEFIDKLEECISKISKEQTKKNDLSDNEGSTLNLEEYRQSIRGIKGEYENLPDIMEDIRDVLEILGKVLSRIIDCIKIENVDGLKGAQVFLQFGLNICRNPTEREAYLKDAWVHYLTLGNTIKIDEAHEKQKKKKKIECQNKRNLLEARLRTEKDPAEKADLQLKLTILIDEIEHIVNQITQTNIELVNNKRSYEHLKETVNLLRDGNRIPEEELEELESLLDEIEQEKLKRDERERIKFLGNTEKKDAYREFEKDGQRKVSNRVKLKLSKQQQVLKQQEVEQQQNQPEQEENEVEQETDSPLEFN